MSGVTSQTGHVQQDGGSVVSRSSGGQGERGTGTQTMICMDLEGWPGKPGKRGFVVPIVYFSMASKWVDGGHHDTTVYVAWSRRSDES